MDFTIVAAVDDKYGIGNSQLESTIPWKNTPDGIADMKFFYNLTVSKQTTVHAVIMGRVTAETIPKIYWPLLKRINIVISRQYSQNERIDATMPPTFAEVIYMSSLNEALNWCKKFNINRVFVIGGAQIYNIAIIHPLCKQVLLTRIPGDFNCDVFFPHDALGRYEAHLSHEYELFRKYHKFILFEQYISSNHDEEVYLKLLQKCLVSKPRTNRTDILTYGDFGAQLRFPLSYLRLGTTAEKPHYSDYRLILPLLTTKKVVFRSVYHELIWFLRGDTTTDYLTSNGVFIWSGNTSREYLNSIGKSEYPVGTVGPAYGHQWRNFGADWRESNTSTECGIDQINNLIEGIRREPFGRRHIVTAWNPAQVNEAALPPCHVMFQMYVDVDATTKYKLSCMVTMRSSDVFLGLPFNIASYALLTHMIAYVLDYIPGEVILNLGDYHLYENQLIAAKKQLQRNSRQFPTITMPPRADDASIDDFINKFTIDDIVVSDYCPHPYIQCDMIA